MSRNFVLVDFENVQPGSLGALSPDTCDIKVFTGAQQRKVELSLAQALQRFGACAEWIQITGSGKDALDFHIAFYIGRLSAGHEDASFTIVSRDTGFDPLVKHLAKLGIGCRRVAAIDAITPAGTLAAPAGKAPAKPRRRGANAAPAKAAAPKPVRAKAAPAPAAAAKKAPAPRAKPAKTARPSSAVQRFVPQALELLASQKHPPARLSRLRSALSSWFGPELADADVDALVALLAKTGRLAVDGARISYSA